MTNLAELRISSMLDIRSFAKFVMCKFIVVYYESWSKHRR